MDWFSFHVLLAYRTSKHSPTDATPFSSVYGAKEVVPLEVMVPSAWPALVSKLSDTQDWIYEVETLEERRQCIKQMAIALETNKKPTIESKTLNTVCCRVKTAGHIQKGLCAILLLNVKWPYVIRESYNSCSFLIYKLDLESLLPHVNLKLLNLHYL